LSARSRWCLVTVLTVAAGVRIHGLAFGLPALYDPDEPLFVLNAIKLIHDQTLNPGWFGHPGTTTLYALAIVDLIVFGFGWLTGRYADPAAFGQAIYGNSALIFLPNRAFILMCGVLCVYLTFRLGCRLFGVRVGLVAALLLAIDPLHVKYSQIIRTDVHATVFILLCALSAVAIARRGRRASYVVAGVWLGLALATKWPAGLVLMAMAGGTIVRIIDCPGERWIQVRHLVLGGLVGLATLVTASPYLVLDYTAVLRDLHSEARPYHLSATGHGPWRNAVWYVQTCLQPAFGVAGLVAVVGGLAVAVRHSRPFGLVIVPFIGALFIVISSQALIWDRWAVPLLPFLSIAAAVGFVALIRAARRVAGAPAAPIVATAAGLILVVPLLASTVARATERVNDTRRLSTRWILDHVPPGSRILSEYLALDLLNRGWRMKFPVGDGGCVDVDTNVNAKISYTTIDRWRGKRPIIDLGTMNPATVPSCGVDYAVLVDYDRYLADDVGRYTQEISNYRRIIASGTIVATFHPLEGHVGGYTVRIVKLNGPPL